MDTLGYRGAWQPKCPSPCLRTGHYSDGVALMWKRDLWEGEEVFQGLLSDETIFDNYTPFVAALLKSRISPSIRVLVFSTHLKSGRNVESVTIRERQLKLVEDKIDSILSTINNGAAESGDNVINLIVCGDFNEDPTAESIRRLRWKNAYYRKFINPPKNIAVTAVRQQPITSPPLSPSMLHPTTVKERKSNYHRKDKRGRITRTIDYIFYSGSDISVSALLPLMPLEELNAQNLNLPDSDNPSDHFYIGAKFRILLLPPSPSIAAPHGGGEKVNESEKSSVVVPAMRFGANYASNRPIDSPRNVRWFVALLGAVAVSETAVNTLV